MAILLQRRSQWRRKTLPILWRRLLLLLLRGICCGLLHLIVIVLLGRIVIVARGFPLLRHPCNVCGTTEMMEKARKNVSEMSFSGVAGAFLRQQAGMTIVWMVRCGGC